jgi:hypothetical protein
MIPPRSQLGGVDGGVRYAKGTSITSTPKLAWKDGYVLDWHPEMDRLISAFG